MATKGIYKLDDGQCCPTNCFPAKSLLQPRYEDGASHWQVARQNVDKTKIEWLFGTKATQLNWKECLREAYSPRAEKVLSGAQLIKLHHVKKPSDLCSVNISHQNFALAKEEDFVQFDSVAYINATENLLTLEIFRKFPGLRELELSLNGLRNLKVNVGDFPHLEILDLSYNNLSPNDVQTLGILPRLKVLHLTANGLSSLPLDLAASESESSPRFPAMEVLLLDDNHLSHPNVFVSLANLRSLKQLNLDKNGIKEVPYLHYEDSAHFSIHPLSAKSGIRAGLRYRKNAQKKLQQDQSPRLSQQHSYVVAQNSKDPDRTEIIFQTGPPEQMAQERSPSPLADPKASPSINTEFVLPLPELRFLSLANNQIEHEEDLLAVALFPSLTELTFYGNPFTTSRSGDPPLLTSFLQNKLGIKLVRKKVSKLEKPRIFIPIKANREIKSQLPKVRKRPLMKETALETIFWQLWMGADLDPTRRISLQEAEPDPQSRSLSLFYDSEQSILHTLKPEERSAPISVASFTCENPASRSSLEDLLSENSLLHLSSVDKILADSIPPSLSLSEQSQSEVLLPCESASQGQGHSGFTPTEPLSVDQVLFESPPQPENMSESIPSMRTPSAEQPLHIELEPVPPSNLPLEERKLSELVLIVGSEEQDISKTLLPTSSVGEQSQSASITLLDSSLPEQKQSKPVVPSESAVGEQDLGMSLSPVRSLSAEKNLQEDVPPSGSSTEDQQESTLFSYSSGEGLSECVSLIGSSARDLSEVPLPTLSLVEVIDEGQAEPSLLPTLVFQDMTPSDSEGQERPGFLPPSSSVVEDGQKEALTLADSPSVQKSLPLLLSPSRSASGELHELFAWVRSYASPSELEDNTSVENEMLTSSKEDIPEEEKSEPIFMTQVDESINSRLKPPSPGTKAESPRVPEKLKGYEELLGGNPGSDFVEPKGIQQSIQALEKALRYPLVYREPTARLDCFQKPYVSAKKKVLRVPAPTVRKTRMERLEEILLELRKPTNIVHLPLVCILRRKKENWREYREALELLKEFQKDYKSLVATCNMMSEPKSVGKEQVAEGAMNHSQKVRSLPEIKVRRKLEESSVQVLQEKNDLPSYQ